MNCKKVSHLTSAHSRYDTRIFIKMCSSLATQDYAVTLVVADGLGEQFKNDVRIIDVGAKSGRRLSRMTKTVRRVYDKALELDADIYHLHDPELMPIGLKLKKNGKKVIFDAHEDLPKQILGKPYLNPVARVVLSNMFDLFERWVCPKFDAIIAATPFIREKFLSINPNSVDINNFPLLGELANTTEWSRKENEVAYVGGVAKTRGIEQIVQAMELTQNVRLNLAGKFDDRMLEKSIKELPAWKKVNELGFLSRKEVNTVLAKSKVGLVILHPIINYKDALPVKMFEYMAAGIPVVASDFPLWEKIIEGEQCGICVDPFDIKATASAIQYLLTHPSEAEKMGKLGRMAVEKKYNWVIEESKLFELYKGLLN